MTQQPEPAQQVSDLRLQFFPAPTAAVTADAPSHTRLIEMPAIVVNDALSRSPFLVQCNCACK
jgi:hypothetical protein